MADEKATTPEYLYHYTNVDALALILKNRSIRLNSLDKMDDSSRAVINRQAEFWEIYICEFMDG